MNVIYSVKDYVTNVFDFQQATASGAIDIVAVQHESGAVRCTPFHVHFGGVELKNKAEKTVTLVVNGVVVPDVHMKLGAAGEAFFVDSVESPVEDDYSTSPLVSPSSSLTLPVCTRSSKQSIATETLPTSSAAKTKAIPSTPSNAARNLGQADDCREEPAEWHDTYRLVSDSRLPPFHREASAPSERLTWGWGALPIVRTASAGDLSGDTEETLAEEEGHSMVKSDSVYFDAVEAENLQAGNYVADHPCMSLCGHLLGEAQTREQAHAIFSDNIVTFESFKENPVSFLQNPDLRFLVDGKICPFNADIQTYFVSRVLFPSAQPLSLTCGWSPNTRQCRRASERLESSFWFGDVEEENEEDDEDGDEGDNDDDKHPRRWFQWFPRSSSSDDTPVRPAFQPVDVAPVKPSSTENPPVFFRKTLLPSQDQLARMGLRHGTNDIEFVVATSSGSERVSAKLYLWPMSTKIIIAEIDGAISRTTASGRRLSTLLASKDKGTTSLHQGALEFYGRAARNGYRVVYLTSHGLSQADLIHTMLRGSSGKRDQSLPNGPVLLSPDRLLQSDTDEITSVTRDFKFAALNGIRTLFPGDVNPFYAAFGKTYADSVIFTQVGVFPGKVFLVDEGDGRLRHRSMMNYQESYSSLLGLVDKMFPPICSPSRRQPKRRDSNATTDTDGSLSNSLASSSSLPSSPRSAAMTISPPGSMKRVFTATEEFVSDVLSSHIRTRSMNDEAYNDVNFWRIQPGSV